MCKENFYIEVIMKYLLGKPYMSTRNWPRFLAPIILLAIITGFLAGYTYLLSQQVNSLQIAEHPNIPTPDMAEREYIIT
jgi:hypothetical protein